MIRRARYKLARGLFRLAFWVDRTAWNTRNRPVSPKGHDGRVPRVPTVPRVGQQ